MGKLYTDHSPNNPTVVLTNTQIVSGVQPVLVAQALVQEYSAPAPQFIYQDRETIKEVQKIVYVDVPTTIYETKEVIKEVPLIQERIVYKDVIKEVLVPTIQIKERIVEIPRITVQFKVPDWCYLTIGVESLVLVLMLLMKVQR